MSTARHPPETTPILCTIRFSLIPDTSTILIYRPSTLSHRRALSQGKRAHLSGVFDRRRDELAVLNRRLEHLWDRRLGEDALLLAFDGQVHVDAAALRGRDLDAEAVLREENVPRVGRVELDRRRSAGDLQREGWGAGDGDGGDDVLDEYARLGAVDYGEISLGGADVDITATHVHIVTPLILPFTMTVEFLQPYRLIVWLRSVFSTITDESFS